MTDKKLLSDEIIKLCDEKIFEFKTTPRDKTIQYNLGFISALTMIRSFVKEVIK